MDYVKVGKIVHYFDKILVAVIGATDGDIKIGDTLRYGEDGALEEKIESIQIDHAQVELIKKGGEGAIKVSSEVKSGAIVYKIV